MRKGTIITISIISVIIVILVAYFIVQNNIENQRYEQNIKDNQAKEDKIHYLIDLSISNNPSFKNCYIVDGKEAMIQNPSNMRNCKNGYCELIYSYCYDSYCKDLALYCAQKINDLTLFRELTKLYEE